MLFTVFTPTYNRAYIIEKLYSSLLNQVLSDFEWIIVDDGSTDDTEKLILKFIEEKKLDIKYVKQENGGKHRAINRGLREARGELFFIVDSDDKLSKDALSTLFVYYQKVKNDNDIAGVVGLRCSPEGKTIGTYFPKNELICNNFDYRYKYKIKGDKAEAVKTEVFRKYPFPEIDNEKFIAEGIVWNRIARKYKFMYVNKNIYECEYLSDGLSKASWINRMRNPKSACLLYQELSTCNIPIIIKMKAIINYWRFKLCAKSKFSDSFQNVNMLLSILTLPVAFIIHLNDKRRWKKHIQ
jgi:glycosyltransferase involved in cell wall biosynthesis